MKQTKRVKEAVIEKHIEAEILKEGSWEKINVEDFLKEGRIKEEKEAKELDAQGLIKITIGVDCKPASPRPDTYLDDVLKDTDIVIDKTKTATKFFGAWEWEAIIKKELWTDETAELVYARLRLLYEKGFIRGGKLSPMPSEKP